MRFFFLPMSAILFAFPAVGNESENLRGLRTFYLAVEPPSKAATQCGFTREWLAKRVGPVVSSTGLRLVEFEIADAHLEVVATVLPNCSASMVIEVAAMARLEHSGRTTMVTVWRSGGIGGQEGAALALDASAKALARDWKAANKPQ